MTRMDNRDLDTFKKDIKFATLLEKFWMDKLIEKILTDPLVTDAYYENNGINNDGDYVEKSTRDADYKLIVYSNNGTLNDKLEVKFAPTKGKITFKRADLLDYVKQNAYIYLIYNTGDLSLKKPKDYEFEKHIELIKQNLSSIKWALLKPTEVENYVKCNDPVKIPYMGFKMGYILTPEEIENWFGITWSNYEL